MNRRIFITGATALLVSPKLLLAAEGMTNYEPGLIQQKLSAGETVLVDYSATWCSTCKRQERVLNELRASNSEFDRNISFVKVDWDTYSRHEVTTSRKVPRRSTLILLKGDEELGRIVAGTSTDQIKALLDLALIDS